MESEQLEVNLLVFYVLIILLLVGVLIIASLIRHVINLKKSNSELTMSLNECNECLENFTYIEEKLKGYENDIEQIKEGRRR